MAPFLRAIAAITLMTWGALRVSAELQMPGYPVVQNFTDTALFRNNSMSFVLTQSKDGLLLASVGRELYSFDGRQWTRLRLRNVDDLGAISCDLDGRIVVGTYDTPGYLQSEASGELSFVSLAHLVPDEYKKLKVFSQIRAAADGVYFSTFYHVLRWDRASRIDVWPTQDVFPYVVVAGGKAFVSDSDRGLLRVDGTQLELVPGSAPSQIVAGGQPEKVTCAAPFRDGWLMVTERDGFRFFNGSMLSPIELPASSRLRGNAAPFVDLHRLDGEQWVARDTRSRMVFIDGNGDVVGQWNPNDYPGITTEGVFVDRDRKAWTSTHMGALRLELNPAARVLDARTGWEAVPASIYADGDRRLFVTTEQTCEWVPGTVPGTGVLRPIPELGVVLAVVVGDIFYSKRESEPLMCQYADGRVEAVLPRGSWRVHPSKHDNTTVFAEDYPQTMRVLKKQDGRWVQVTDTQKVPLQFAGMVDDGTHLWFATGNDHVARAAKEPFLANFTVFGREHNLPPLWIRPFDFGNEVLFSTRRGIYVFDETRKAFMRDPRFTEVPEPIAREPLSTQTDSFGNIWVSSANGTGIMRRRPDGTYAWDTGTLSCMGGLQITNMSWDPAGWMWCFVQGGIFAVRPDTGARGSIGFSVQLRGVTDLRSGGVIASSWASLPPRTIFPYSRNSLQFDVAAPEFSAPSNVEFQARLVGSDDAWSPWGASSVFRHPGLGEGDYVFEYRARDGFGRLTTGTPFVFTVDPPFLRSPAAYVFYVIAVGGAVLMIVVLSSRRLKAKNELLQTLVRERTASLEEAQRKLIESSRLAGMAEVASGMLHAVGNALNTINVSVSLVSDGLKNLHDPTAKVLPLLKAHESDLADFLVRDPKGRLVPQYLEASALHAREERARLLSEIEQVSAGIDEIKAIVAKQQVHTAVKGPLEALEAGLLLEDALEHARRQRPGARARVVRSIEPNTRVLAQRGKAVDLLTRIAENALDACRDVPEPVVTVRVERAESGRVRFGIGDNGVGVAPENLTRIFAQPSLSGGTRGGSLHEAANAAAEMNGLIRVDSEGLGKGAIFWIELPGAP